MNRPCLQLGRRSVRKRESPIFSFHHPKVVLFIVRLHTLLIYKNACSESVAMSSSFSTEGVLIEPWCKSSIQTRLFLDESSSTSGSRLQPSLTHIGMFSNPTTKARVSIFPALSELFCALFCNFHIGLSNHNAYDWLEPWCYYFIQNKCWKDLYREEPRVQGGAVCVGSISLLNSEKFPQLAPWHLFIQ